MELYDIAGSRDLEIRPAAVFAFIKIFPFLAGAIALAYMAWWIFPSMIWIALLCALLAAYRYTYIRKIRYIITPEIIRIQRGVFFRRIDQVELWRIKDYVITQSFLLQLFRLMDLMLKGTDMENPVIWLRGIPYSNLVDILRERVNDARQHNRVYELN